MKEKFQDAVEKLKAAKLATQVRDYMCDALEACHNEIVSANSKSFYDAVTKAADEGYFEKYVDSKSAEIEAGSIDVTKLDKSLQDRLIELDHSVALLENNANDGASSLTKLDNEFHTNVTEIKQSIALLELDLDNFSITIDKLNKQVNNNSSNLNLTAEKLANDVESVDRKYNRSVLILESRIKDCDAATKIAQDTADNAALAVDRLRGHCATLIRNVKTSLEAELADVVREQDTLSSAIADLRADIDAIPETCAYQTESIETIWQQLNKLAESIRNDNTTEKVETFIDSVAKLSTGFTKTTEEIQNTLQEMDNRVDELDSAIYQMKRHVDWLSESYDLRTAKLKDLEEQRDNLLRQNTELSSRLDHIEHQLTDLDEMRKAIDTLMAHLVPEG